MHKCEPYSFFDTTLPPDHLLRFRKNLSLPY